MALTRYKIRYLATSCEYIYLTSRHNDLTSHYKSWTVTDKMKFDQINGGQSSYEEKHVACQKLTFVELDEVKDV